MSYTLYQQEGCPHCEKVAERLQELEVAYETVWVSKLHSRRDKLKSLKGQRQVPVIVDQKRGVTMPESDRILEYIDKTHTGKKAE